MPVGVVRSYEDELAWERAKAIARRQYPELSGDRFYRVVMTIYKNITGYTLRRRTRRRESPGHW